MHNRPRRDRRFMLCAAAACAFILAAGLGHDWHMLVPALACFVTAWEQA